MKWKRGVRHVQRGERGRRVRHCSNHYDHQRIVAQPMHTAADCLGHVGKPVNQVLDRDSGDDFIVIPGDMAVAYVPFVAVAPDLSHWEIPCEVRAVSCEGTWQCLDATGLRVTEIELVSIAFGLDPDGGLYHVFDRRTRYPAIYPVNRHLVRRDVPDFLVVRNHVLLGNTLAEDMVDPFLEIGRRRIVVIQIMVQALEAILRSEIIETVLEGVFDIAAV